MDDVKKIYQIAIGDMAGQSVDVIYQIGNEVFERDLKPKIYKEAIDEIQKHKKNGVPVILISSGPTMAIQAIAKFLEVDDFFSIGPKIENHALTNQLSESFAFMEGKTKIAEFEAKKRNTNLANCFFYADSVHDIPLLSSVGKPRAVNPDRGLKKECLKNGWPILEFQNTLKDSPL